MKFSIITATFNSEDYIEDCLNSVRSQIVRNFEHVFVDGNSTDKTIEIIQQYKIDNPDIPVKLIQSKPKGVSNAFNIGIENAEGDFLIFLNSDDYFTQETSLAKITEILDKHKEIEYLQGSLRMDINGVKVSTWETIVTKRLYSILLSARMPVSHQNSVIARSLFNQYGGFREDMISNMDSEFLVRIRKNTEIYLTVENFATYRIREGQVSRQNSAQIIWDYWKFLVDEYGIVPGLDGFRLLTESQKNVKWVERPVETVGRKIMRKLNIS